MAPMVPQHLHKGSLSVDTLPRSVISAWFSHILLPLVKKLFYPVQWIISNYHFAQFIYEINMIYMIIWIILRNRLHSTRMLHRFLVENFMKCTNNYIAKVSLQAKSRTLIGILVINVIRKGGWNDQRLGNIL